MRRLFLGFLSILPGFAATIVQYNGANTGTDSIFVGQSITTPSGGPWSSLTFNLFDAQDAPSANGTLYLLSQAYTGAPSGLSNATPGFLASTASISGGIWSFAPSVTLNGNTQYFFYTDGLNNILRANTTGSYAGGEAYTSIGANSAFFLDTVTDTLFNLSGTERAVTGVPEPASVVLLGAGLIVLGARALRASAD